MEGIQENRVYRSQRWPYFRRPAISLSLNLRPICHFNLLPIPTILTF